MSRLPDLSLDLNRPLQSQIHEQLVQWILLGRLKGGDRLPPTRRLSEQLGVSRNTMTAVFEQLCAEGFLQAQPGRGTFVSRDLAPQFLAPKTQNFALSPPPPMSDYAQFLAHQTTRHHHQAKPFTPGVPDLQALPNQIWQRLWRRHQDRSVLLGYEDDQGYLPLREELANYLTISRGVRCNAQNILITQGAQQALSLCSVLLVNQGDVVLHENPGYLGAKFALSAQQPTFTSVPLTKDQVLDVNWLVSQGATTAAANVLYCTPTHQYPMGGLMSARQRLQLLEWAQENSVWIIEDDYDSEFHYQHKPVAAMQGMTDSSQVIYVGSFSKTVFPSLRMGYLVLPEPLVALFVKAKSFQTGESSLIPQAVMADFLMEGHFERHVRRMRQNYKQKWQDLEQKIQQTLSDKVRIVAESAGMHLVLEVASDVDDRALLQKVKDAGFGGSALSMYYLNEPDKQGLVVGFSNTSEADRTRLVALLDQCI